MGGIISAAIGVHGLIWNALHPKMHGLDDVPLRVGLPSDTLERFYNTGYFNWIYKNHQGHHVMGGQANYNVCCPLVDHLVGTYIPEDDWKPKMRASPADCDIFTKVV